MMMRIRICGQAAPAELKPPPGRRLEYDTATVECPVSSSRSAQYERMLRERLAGRGWTARRIMDALNGGMGRGAAALLAGDCDALIACGEDQDLEIIRQILESGPGPELWIFPPPQPPGMAAQGREASLGWMEISGDIGQTASRLQAAQAQMQAGSGRAAPIAVVRFASGREPHAKTELRLIEHLRARGPVEYISLYSGWFYDLGRLQAGAVLEELRRRWPAQTPALIASASLLPGQLQAAEKRSGQAGGFRLLISERPAAFLPPQPSSRQLESVINFLPAEGTGHSPAGSAE